MSAHFALDPDMTDADWAAAMALARRSYKCPTCGRPQHPGETCETGHARDESPVGQVLTEPQEGQQ